MKISDRTLICLSLAVGMVSLYINFRLAVGLAKVQADADQTIADVKASPVGQVLGFLGLK